MTNNDYKKIVDKITLKENKKKNALYSFLCGGILGMLAQIIVDILIKCFNVQKKDATSIMIVLFIFVASLLTALGVFDKFVKKLKAGLVIPITGFAHSMTSAMIDYKREGFVTGIGSNAFKLAGTVILYGVVFAYLFGIIRFLLFGG